MTSRAQKEAQSRYDRTRPETISIRLNDSEQALLDPHRQVGEGRGKALKRLAFERIRQLFTVKGS